jgi:hypothetical protein
MYQVGWGAARISKQKITLLPSIKYSEYASNPEKGHPRMLLSKPPAEKSCGSQRNGSILLLLTFQSEGNRLICQTSVTHSHNREQGQIVHDNTGQYHRAQLHTTYANRVCYLTTQ